MTTSTPPQICFISPVLTFTLATGFNNNKINAAAVKIIEFIKFGSGRQRKVGRSYIK